MPLQEPVSEDAGCQLAEDTGGLLHGSQGMDSVSVFSECFAVNSQALRFKLHRRLPHAAYVFRVLSGEGQPGGVEMVLIHSMNLESSLLEEWKPHGRVSNTDIPFRPKSLGLSGGCLAKTASRAVWRAAPPGAWGRLGPEASASPEIETLQKKLPTW